MLLTEKAIKILNDDFSMDNPYSRSQWDWIEYNERMDKLDRRLKREVSKELNS